MNKSVIYEDAGKISVSIKDAMRYAGCRDSAPEIYAVAENLLAELREYAALRACCTELPIDRENTSGEITIGTIHTASKSLDKNLAGCKSAIIFAATIGTGADKLCAKYLKTAPSKAVVAGALGSAMIESWCDEVCARLGREYAVIGKRLKPRFSPGYGGFELSAQRKIGDILNTEKTIGLYFTDSMMMLPEKSVTAVIGICCADMEK